MLGEGSLKIDQLLSLVKVRYVEAREIDRFDPDHQSFFNINTEADLKKARGLINRVKSPDSLCPVSDRFCREE